MPPKPGAKECGDDDARYAEMVRAKGGGCAICGNPPKTRRLHVDHDHRTGKIRGLLCHRCNRALPNWISGPWLWRALQYLSAHGTGKAWKGCLTRGSTTRAPTSPPRST